MQSESCGPYRSIVIENNKLVCKVPFMNCVELLKQHHLTIQAGIVSVPVELKPYVMKAEFVNWLQQSRYDTVKKVTNMPPKVQFHD